MSSFIYFCHQPSDARVESSYIYVLLHRHSDSCQIKLKLHAVMQRMPLIPGHLLESINHYI